VRTFSLLLQDARGEDRVDQVESFVAGDESGSFGLLAGPERFMTCLGFGLARFRPAGGSWEYLALPGALVTFSGDHLVLSTRRYLRDADYRRVSAQLTEQLAVEERDLAATRESLRRLESAMLERLRELARGGKGAS
jgi:F-type H+-transporting ATPase subunit epsilon